MCKDTASRAKCQISTSECNGIVHFFITERGRNSTKLNLFAYFRGAAYLQAARQIKITASRAKRQISTSECNGIVHFFITERGRNSTKLNLFEHFRGAAYLQAARQIKITASRAKANISHRLQGTLPIGLPSKPSLRDGNLFSPRRETCASAERKASLRGGTNQRLRPIGPHGPPDRENRPTEKPQSPHCKNRNLPTGSRAKAVKTKVLTIFNYWGGVF